MWYFGIQPIQGQATILGDAFMTGVFLFSDPSLFHSPFSSFLYEPTAYYTVFDRVNSRVGFGYKEPTVRSDVKCHTSAPVVIIISVVAGVVGCIIVSIILAVVIKRRRHHGYSHIQSPHHGHHGHH